ncbi:MAG TPA: hypothetical protein PK988_07355 [Candidatus Sumerlaeota bacterium]|nr:hypothetical protein [Candidatus Sumerlaeota bacterium]
MAAALIGGYVMLVLDIRFEHRRVLEHPQPWIPIIYSLTMVLLGGICWGLWKRQWARYALVALFAGSIAVGLLGVWFHVDESLVEDVKQLFSVWKTTGNPGIGFRPPLLAPLSFAGLGILGVIASWPRK